MAKLDSICVYCGSGNGDDPAYLHAAEAFGAALAAAGLRLVYGGGSTGLMGAVARATLAGGGRVTGVIPGFLVERELKQAGLTETIEVPDMHTRKRIMFERSDAFVALPGGIGTLEEVVEMMTWAVLGRHQKPVVLADVGGFWSPLVALIDHMKAARFIRDGFDQHYLVAASVDEIIPAVASIVGRIGESRMAGDRDVVERM